MEIMIKKIDYLKKKLNVQKDQIKAAQKMSKTKLFKKIVKSLSVPTQTFVNMQLTQYKKKNRGRRFSIKDKLLALAIYKKSPKGYNFLRKIFVIPSKRTLQNVLKQITLKPGLNPVIFEQIKNATEKFNTEQRLCILMFDEMALSPAMNLNIPADQIIGFEDFGKDVNSNQTENIADHVPKIHTGWQTKNCYHLKLLLDLDDGEDELRMCNKLTEAHVLPEKIPKMKVKHAAQVFSQRVSGALRFCARKHLLPQECTDTADLLLLFDQLFDSFNGGSYKITHKIYKTCVKNNSEHFTLWNKILPVLCSMAFKTEAKKGMVL
ncbi:hypothetical protein HF086_005232 [Spodoptera exigua]|uniref:Transposable element P transposase n=1 Tax=Spodoptera exigua TaxID=7107 RepID=A0A922MZB1_SPOEX|nr:hypothetical protein HF086_005232 [Spodoptera exigua]